jgi:putative spermidine/putrescine transport system ATP-binding protein
LDPESDMTVRAAVQDVSVRLGNVQALDHVSLVVEPGQFLALLGPSGSGKTTTLNVLAGFVRPDSGRVTFDDKDVTPIPPHRRDLGIVFQGYALFPHMTAGQNVGFPLRMRRLPAADRRQKVFAALELVGLADHVDRSVATLSGGQKQRVALARAIVFEPAMMLLDEPLAALDKQLRDQMQLELRSLQRRVGITTISVTHDQVEALTMADQVAVMRDGRIEQVAPPQDLYLRPATEFVARFLGEANVLPVDRGNLPGFGAIGQGQLTGQAVLRPEHLHITTSPAPGRLHTTATVDQVVFQGPRFRAHVRLASHPDVELTVAEPSAGGDQELRPGDTVTLALDPNVIHVILGDRTGI